MKFSHIVYNNNKIMLNVYFIWGYPYTKFEVSSIRLS